MTAFPDHKAMTAAPGKPLVVTVPVELDAIAAHGPDRRVRCSGRQRPIHR